MIGALLDPKWSQQISLLTPSWASSPCGLIHELTEMVGLDDVKGEFFSTHGKVKATGNRQGKSSLRSLSLDLIITGNAGTGKSTIAQLYATYLHSLGNVLNYSGSNYNPNYLTEDNGVIVGMICL
ncbi:hypothetical protein LI328DRAFT_170531 [Trichoderma asperelloides]|nr:hypothetical protein LI328DRAFT_170531 [Trichoderma asperelloides]